MQEKQKRPPEVNSQAASLSMSTILYVANCRASLYIEIFWNITHAVCLFSMLFCFFEDFVFGLGADDKVTVYTSVFTGKSFLHASHLLLTPEG
jgi:hypothetical protein